jgi:hypothetical protein
MDQAFDWAVVAAQVTMDQEFDWAVHGLAARDLATDWAVHGLTTRDLATDWAVQVCLPVRDLGFDWAVAGQFTRDLETDWAIVEENLITVDAAVDWSVGTLVTKDAAFDWEVMRMPYDESVRAEFSGIDLADGVHTHVLVGTDLGTLVTAYDAVRGSSGRWRQCDVRQEFVSMAIPLLVEFTSASDLAAWIAALKAACRAGGSLVWQWSSTDPARSFTIGCSPEPQIVEDNAYILQHRAEFTLALVRWPS